MIIAVTGHRPDKLWGYDLKHPKYNKLYNMLYNLLDKYYVGHCITGMALGADTIFAYAALKYKKEYPDTILECAIPCQNHSKKWQNKDRDRYDKILKQSEIITLVSDEEYKPWLMQKRNEYMVDRCELLIAVWDGSKGGTGNCVAYAKKKGKIIVVINPKDI